MSRFVVSFIVLSVAAAMTACTSDEPSAWPPTGAGGAGGTPTIVTEGGGGGMGGAGGHASLPVGPGSLDPGFGDGGVVALPQAERIHDLGVDSQGRVILVYEHSEVRMVPSPEEPTETLSWREPRYALARLTAHGVLDPSFGSEGIVELSTMLPLECHIGDCQSITSTLTAEWALTVTPDDEVLLAARYGAIAAPEGSYYYSPNSPSVQSTVLRFNSSGTRDLNFGNNGELQCHKGQATYAWQAQSNAGWDNGHCQGGVRPLVLRDGRILIAYANDIQVLYSDGTIDTSFAPLNILHKAGEMGGAPKSTTLCQHITGVDYFNSEYYPARILYYSEQPEGIFVGMDCENSYGEHDEGVVRKYALLVDFGGEPLDAYNSLIQAKNSDQFSNAIDGEFYVVRYMLNQWGALDDFIDIYMRSPSGSGTIWLDSELAKALAVGYQPIIGLSPDHKLLVLDDDRLLRLTLSDGAQATPDVAFGNAGVVTPPPGLTRAGRNKMAFSKSGVVVLMASELGSLHLLRYLL